MTGELYALLTLAFGLGLVHALDADHIAAVSVLSSEKTTLHKSLGFAIQWALGHGSIILIMTLLFMTLGESVPQLLSVVAEQVVGLVLIFLGMALIYRIQRYRLRLHFHSHEGYLPHAHWYQKDETDSGHQTHKAVYVGGLHGMAGSAPLLAALPVVQSGNLSEIVLYVAIFSAGVFVAMFSFGGVFALCMKKIMHKSNVWMKSVQLFIAIASIGIGVRLVSG